jgi:hypothetical protein
MLKFKSFRERTTKEQLAVVPGSTAAINGELAKLPVDKIDYPVENENGLPFKDDMVHLKDNKFKAQPIPEVYEWVDVENLVTINEVKLLNEEHLSDNELKDREKIVKKLKKHKDKFEDKYGKDAMGVMYGVATKLAKQHNEETVHKMSGHEIAEKAHKGENVGHGGFKKVEKAAEKEYGSKKAGERVAAAVMWKKYRKEETLLEAYPSRHIPTTGSPNDYVRRSRTYRKFGLHHIAQYPELLAQRLLKIRNKNRLVNVTTGLQSPVGSFIYNPAPIGEEALNEIKTYKGYGEKSTLEVNPTDQASALFLAKKYSELTENATTSEQKEQYARYTQRFFDVANRIKHASARNFPHAKHYHESIVEDIEADNAYEALRIAATEPEGIEIELATGATLFVTQQDAKELLSQYTTEEQVSNALQTRYLGEEEMCRPGDDDLDDHTGKFKLHNLGADYQMHVLGLPHYQDDDMHGKSSREEAKAALDFHLNHMKDLRAKVAKKYGEATAEDMEKQAAIHLHHFGTAKPLLNVITSVPEHEYTKEEDEGEKYDDDKHDDATANQAAALVKNRIDPDDDQDDHDPEFAAALLFLTHLHGEQLNNFVRKEQNIIDSKSNELRSADDVDDSLKNAKDKDMWGKFSGHLNNAVNNVRRVAERKHGSDLADDLYGHTSSVMRLRKLPSEDKANRRKEVAKIKEIQEKHLGKYAGAIR